MSQLDRNVFGPEYADRVDAANRAQSKHEQACYAFVQGKIDERAFRKACEELYAVLARLDR